jgi:hypothetical protein
MSHFKMIYLTCFMHVLFSFRFFEMIVTLEHTLCLVNALLVNID